MRRIVLARFIFSIPLMRTMGFRKGISMANAVANLGISLALRGRALFFRLAFGPRAV